MSHPMLHMLVATLKKRILVASSLFLQAIVAATTDSTSYTNTHNGGVRTGKWVVGVASRKSSSGTAADPTAVTFCGTALVKLGSRASGRTNVSIWISTTDITTTGTDPVVITAPANIDRPMSILWSADNLSDPGTVIDFASSTASPATLDTDSVAGCLMFGIAANSAAVGSTWTGLTEDIENTAGANRVSGASGAFATAGTQSISVTHSATEGASLVVAVR